MCPVPGAGTLTSAYYADDRVQSLTQDGHTHTLGLDPNERLRTDTTDAVNTETDHYADDSDNPSWTTQGLTRTRNIQDVNGNLVATHDQNGSTLQLADLHGDIAAHASVTALNDPNAIYEFRLHQPAR